MNLRILLNSEPYLNTNISRLWYFKQLKFVHATYFKNTLQINNNLDVPIIFHGVIKMRKNFEMQDLVGIKALCNSCFRYLSQLQPEKNVRSQNFQDKLSTRTT